MFRVLFLLLIASLAAAQDVRITELQAINTSGIQDEDQTYQGWVEIWNPQLPTTTSPFGAINLANYSLNDGTTTWTFPNVQLMPDKRMVVWTSGKNRRTAITPLHTNFTLGTAAGALILRNPSGTVISHLAYPALAADISYGRDEWDTTISPTQKGAYENPTPGERNNYSGAGVAGKLTFSVASRAFAGSMSFTITQDDPTATIRYTLNGTVPTANSLPYSSAITISNTTQVRARVFKTGLLPGEVETRAFLLVDSAVYTSFSSPMPLLVVSNFGGGQPPPEGNQAGYVWLWSPGADGRARLSDVPEFASRLAMDRRGSSTLNNPKYNVNLELRKARDDDDSKAALLGMAEGSDYVLHGPYDYDRAEIRNPFAYQLSRSAGRYAPDTRMVEVFFKVSSGSLTFTGAGSGDYFGIYNLMEKIRRDKDRVDITNLRETDNDSIKKTGGYIFKVDRIDTGETGFSAGGQALAYSEPKEVEIKSPQRDPQEAYLTSYINSFYSSLLSSTWNTSTGYAAYLDVPAAIDHHLINAWLMNVDGLRLSGFWSKDRGGKLVPGPVWDFDRAMESVDGRDDNPAAWRGTDDSTDYFSYTWWNRLFIDIDFYQKYIDRWQELRRSAFSQASTEALIDSLNAQMPAECIARDLARWGLAKRTATFPNSPSAAYDGTQAGEIKRLKEWLQVRANFFDRQWLGPVTPSQPAGNVAVGTAITLSRPAGATIYYTLNGTDPRPSGGGPPSGVLTYTGEIIVNSTTRIRARAYQSSWSAPTGFGNPPLVSKWSGLTDVQYSVDTLAAPGLIAITELHYHPTNPTPAELAVDFSFTDSDFEFIELKNLSNVPLDLGGMHFADGIEFTFSGTNAIVLAPGALAILAANPTAFAVRYPGIGNVVGPFKGDLSNGGEHIELRSAGGAVIHDFIYDDAWYPSTDGGGRSLVIYNPTADSMAFSDDKNWRASVGPAGSPGMNEPNLAPTLTAGQTVTGYLPALTIAATASDDTLPVNSLTLAWSKLAGPGTVAFGSPTAATSVVTFDQPGSYALRLSASDSVLTAQSDFTAILRDTPGAWLLRNPGIGTLNDDPDGDGRTNFFEWALRQPPANPMGGDGTTIGVENGHLTLTYTRQKDSPFVRYQVQVTSQPGNWPEPGSGDVSERVLFDDGVTETVQATDNTPMHSQPARFIRLKISSGSGN